MMARAPLGNAAKRIMANTRVTQAESEALAEEFGSMSNALRFFINRWKKEKRDAAHPETLRVVR